MKTPAQLRPAAFRRPRLTIVGCGDVGLRVARRLSHRAGGRWRIFALSSSPERHAVLREAGITPVAGNLDDRRTLHRIAALSPLLVHLAPPAPNGRYDLRTAALLSTLSRAGRTLRLVYGSTTGVYGDAGGARFDETRAPAPATDRARRRVDAERRIRRWAVGGGRHTALLRIPGIYASDRPGGHPRERLLRGTPVLQPEDDVYTNHIHADDLAAIVIAALWRSRPQRAFNACDDTEMKMGDYFDLAAELCALPRPARVSRVEAAQVLSPMQLSFMHESRRLDNHRMKRELGVQLQYPTVAEGLQHG